ncbi:thioesterase family protein [Kocuria sp. CNJ-770]|uniref:acyl-CoA thioesterase n=1 Tax=Kocuria sp. CNJ-770 TaxID=1904964 RepID=UPI0009F8CBFC|nr:acyl-CoA thioesterase [Kocuria sp. CNJ-770]
MTVTQQSGVLCRVTMRWGDMDPYGHVNNVEVVRLLEEARIAALGVPVGTGHEVEAPLIPFFSVLPAGTQALITENRIKYLRSLEYRNTPVEVRVWVVSARGGALTLGFEITDVVSRRACVRAETQLAFFVPATGTVLRITPEQQEILAPYSGPPLFR